jgi:hypothetical protein
MRLPPSLGGGGGGGGGGNSSSDGGGGYGSNGQYTLISPHVIIQKNDPYYASMLRALNDLLDAYPEYRAPLNSGNINTEDWVWDLACHGPAGPQACNPLFLSNIIPGQDSAPNSDKFLIGSAFGPAGFALGVPLPSGSASEGESGVPVYRGTRIQAEIEIQGETGLIMSDAARRGYQEGGYSVEAALGESSSAHQANVEAWGDEATYAQAHSLSTAYEREFGLQRSFISLTTDPEIAKSFAGEGGQVYMAVVDPSDLVPQTLPGSGESEYLARNMLPMEPFDPMAAP